MKIAGFQKNSFVDYPGKVAAVLFTPGCNLDCYYCHNRNLLLDNTNDNLMDSAEITEVLRKRKRFLDAVVISGGEPTLQPDLKDFIKEVKAIGYQVKLDTNGTKPDVVKGLIEEGLVDYVAMDIKAPFHKYEHICCTSVKMDDVKRSIGILLKDDVEYEFRTTCAPTLSGDDIENIADAIKGARLYVLQKHRYQVTNEAGNENRDVKVEPCSLVDIAGKIKHKVERCETRGIIVCA